MGIQEIFGDKIPERLSPAEELACFKIYRTDSRPAIRRAAILKIISGHIPFVISVASKYHPKNLTREELVDEGIMGLMHAAMTYRVNKKCKFLSYAVWWIVQTIQAAMYSTTGAMRVSDNTITEAIRVKRNMSLGYSFDEAVALLKNGEMHKAAIFSAINALDPLTLDGYQDIEFAEHDGARTKLCDLLPAEDLAALKARYREKETIYSILNKLSKDEQDLLNKYYGLNDSETYNLNEIGLECCRSHERIRLIKKKILKQLRPKMEEHNFRAILA